MPRNRLIAQLDEELVQGKASLAFWREQLLLLTEDELLSSTRRQIQLREAEVDYLLKARGDLSVGKRS